jgi:signal peptidase I
VRVRRRSGARVRWMLELGGTLAVAVAVALAIQAFLVKPYKIPSTSMVPTLRVGQRILVDRLATHPALGDIVVFHPPNGALIGYEGVCGRNNQGASHTQACDLPKGGESSQTYVKRVVGLPGDHLTIMDGQVFRDGVRERGSYIQACNSGPTSCDFPQQITVPEGFYYMMGDNRGVSDDSRFWGPIPQAWIIGTAFATYWPLDRLGTL